MNGEMKEEVVLMNYLSKKNDAEILYLNSDKSSWVILCRGFEKCSSSDFEKIWSSHPKVSQDIKMFGKTIKTPRYTVNYGQDYSFSGNTIKGTSFDDFKDVSNILEKVNEISESCGLKYKYKMCLVNLYEPDHYIGSHSDNEKQISPNSPIFSLSLGESRIFRIKSKEASKEKLDILLNSGDLIIMGGTMQKTHKHEIPKSKKNKDRRINYTLRCFRS